MKKRKEFTIERFFNAPRDLVWKAWTQPDSLEKWWGPQGFEIRIIKFELKPGGTFHYRMQAADSPTMWGKFVYREIDAPKHLVFVNSFSDEEGNIIRPPFDQNWPKEILNTVNLKEHEGKTKLTLYSWPVNSTGEESKTFEDNFDSMNQGYGGTFDQLKKHLQELQ